MCNVLFELNKFIVQLCCIFKFDTLNFKNSKIDVEKNWNETIVEKNYYYILAK